VVAACGRLLDLLKLSRDVCAPMSTHPARPVSTRLIVSENAWRTFRSKPTANRPPPDYATLHTAQRLNTLHTAAVDVILLIAEGNQLQLRR
jgi:hypothetical protein